MSGSEQALTRALVKALKLLDAVYNRTGHPPLDEQETFVEVTEVLKDHLEQQPPST
tara:strand:+ start:255 stop:422 length:168 start_codon:yes stop_codon:yes gene_type:complete